ncbi:MAG: hypothetical protein WHW07_05200 [Bacteroidales bacterium]
MEKLIKLYKENLLVTNCPYCNSTKFKKHGKYKFTHRYKCKDCKRTFLPSSGTSIHYIHKKELFIEYAEVLKKEGLSSVMKMSKRFNIAKLTSFDWRHKIFSSIPQQNILFKDEAFVGDISFRFSQKGRRGLSKKENDINKRYFSRVLNTTDQNINFVRIATVGNLNAEHLDRVLRKKIMESCKLLIPEKDAFLKFTKNNRIDKKVVHKDVSVYLKHRIVRYYQQLSSKIVNFINYELKGVSTKYLQGYNNFFITKEMQIFDAMTTKYLCQKFVWRIFTQMEETYKEFLDLHCEAKYSRPIKRSWKRTKLYYITQDNILY